jgi:hypothetical protein
MRRMRRWAKVMLAAAAVLFATGALAAEPPRMKPVPTNPTAPTRMTPGVQQRLMTNEQACGINARNNVAIAQQWFRNDCGLGFNFFSSEEKYRQMCLAGNAVDVKEQQATLARCICDKYAAKAVAQNQQRLKMGCPPVPTATWWNASPDYHRNWCLVGANPTKAEEMNRRREAVLAQGCKKPVPVTVAKKGTFTVSKVSESTDTNASTAYLGNIPAVKGTTLQKITNNTSYNLSFLSAFNSSATGARCATVGNPASVLFVLLPGDSRTFPDTDISLGKFFSICANAKGENTLTLHYDYTLTQ